MSVYTDPRALSESGTGAAKKQLSLRSTDTQLKHLELTYQGVLAEQERVPPERPPTSAQPSGGLAGKTRKLCGHELTIKVNDTGLGV